MLPFQAFLGNMKDMTIMEDIGSSSRGPKLETVLYQRVSRA